MDPRRYRKLIVMCVGVVVEAIADHWDIKLPWAPEQITEVIIWVATAITLYLVPNAPPKETTP